VTQGEEGQRPAELDTPEVLAALKAQCSRWLSGHRLVSPAQRLASLALMPEAELPADVYGEGGAHKVLQDEVAGLLGKPAAVFLPKGVIAQLATLRAWADRSGRNVVALHPRSHIELDEDGAYAALHGLRGARAGSDHAAMTLRDLVARTEPLAAVVVELPVRRAGFRLPHWAELVAISDWARDRGVARHMDGARLWESGPWFKHSYAEISSLFDSVYVSFYKGLGGLGGAAVAGEADFIAETRTWLHRHGAHPYAAYPYALAALEGLRRHLPRMVEYQERAAHIARLLAGAGYAVTEPQTNGFQVWLPIAHDRALKANAAMARARGVWLLGAVTATAAPGLAMTEIQVGEAAEDFSDDEILALFAELVAGAS
jgi:threonine aldolase